jgi:hypothetical protein
LKVPAAVVGDQMSTGPPTVLANPAAAISNPSETPHIIKA